MDEKKQKACEKATKRLYEIADRTKALASNPNMSDEDRLAALELEGDLVMQALHVEVHHAETPADEDEKESWR